MNVVRTESTQKSQNNDKKEQLELEISNIATEILNKVNHSLPVRYSRCTTILTRVFQTTYSFTVLAYLVTYPFLVFLNSHRTGCHPATHALALAIFVAMGFYAILYGLRRVIVQSAKFNVALAVITVVHLVYFLLLIGAWIATQVFIFGKDLACKEEWKELWVLLLVWTGLMYVFLFALAPAVILNWKINREWLFPSNTVKTEQSSSISTKA